MNKYHKINTVFKRDRVTNRIIEGEYSCPEFEYLAGNLWSWSEKVDGTNIRVAISDDRVIIMGRTDNAAIQPALMMTIQTLFQPMIPEFNNAPFIFYGEGYGAKIQKSGGNYSPYPKFVLFDIQYNELWLQRESVEDIATRYDIDVVPIVGEGNLTNMVMVVKAGFESQWGHFYAEGIVARPKTELFAREGHRIITKLKRKDFAEQKE